MSLFYKKALTSKNVRSSVTSQEYGTWLNKVLGINVKYTLVHDLYTDYYESKCNSDEGYIFCGGRNGRNWDLIFKTAELTPNYQFYFVMDDFSYTKYGNIELPNVKILHNIPTDDFMREIENCSIVAIPLVSQAPSGLIAIFKAIGSEKSVLVSETVTTREYFCKFPAVMAADSPYN